MPIFVCGINHKTAPIALREKAIFAQEKLALYLNDLVTNEGVREAVLLSTCNRSELYCDADDAEKLTNWFCRQHQIAPAELMPAMYVYQNQEAVEHVMKVACGLDSMVLGESQILGQVKDAFSESCAAGTVGALFNRLFQHVFSVAKDVRTTTAIGACPVSVSSAAVNFIKQNFSGDINQAVILLIGAGYTVDLVLRHLKNHMPKKIIVANRSLEKAEALKVELLTTHAISLTDLPDALAIADIVISATGSALPVVTKAMLAERKKSIFIVDIAVPRDIEIAASELDYVDLYSIDDLKNIIQQNRQGREHAAEKAAEVIQLKSCEFMAWLNSLDKVATTIRAYRKQIEDLCHAELTKSQRQLQRGDNPHDVLASFAYSLTNKLLHTPSVQLRQAGYEGRFDILELVQQFFAIPLTSELRSGE